MWLSVSVSDGPVSILARSHGPQNIMIRVENEDVLQELFPECEIKRLENGAYRFFSVLPCSDVETVLKTETGLDKWTEKQYLEFRFRFMGGEMFCAYCSTSLAKKCCKKRPKANFFFRLETENFLQKLRHFKLVFWERSILNL